MWRTAQSLAALAAAVLAFLSLASAAHADAARRVALVIANGAYAHTGSLRNPVSDGNLIKAALGRAGFQVIDARPNLGIADFREALRSFHAAAAGAEVALIYYAGHGIEARGKNWLIPTDATLQQDGDLDYEAIDLDLVMRATDGARMRVVVLDACRNNPFGHGWRRETRDVSQGLSAVDVDDVLVIYSAAPGQTASDGTGANSPFAEALASRLPQAGLPIQMLGGMVRDDVLRKTGDQQRPFISASITGEPFLLVPDGTARSATPAPATAPPAGLDPRAVELEYWTSVATSNDVAQYNSYLDLYPQGRFANLARLKIAQAIPKTTAPRATAPPPPAATVADQGAGGCPDPRTALACLPRGSSPVVFADPHAANQVAWRNVQAGLSTTQAAAKAAARGSTGRAARLCGIIQSDDSSPLGLHLAATKLKAWNAADGHIDETCAALIDKLL